MRDNGRVSGIARQRLLDLSCFFSGLLLLVVSFGIAANGSELPMLLVYLGLFLFASPGLWAVLRLERRGQDGVPGPLSEDEFARRCEELMRPEADESERLPEALPKSLRDEGFTRDPGLFAHFTRRERNRPGAGQLSYCGPAACAMAALDSEWPNTARAKYIADGFWTAHDEAWFLPRHSPNDDRPRSQPPRWLIADRVFTGHTHCPSGHIATHHLTGRDEDEGRDVVLRECWYEACGLTWAEKAWTVEETA